VNRTESPAATKALRHTLLVRVTHWVTVVAFIALIVTGGEIVISHPRFYWGETGNVNMKPWLTIPIPASRDSVPTGYNYQMPDQNGWSRYLHFEAAWVTVLTAFVYGFSSVLNGHFRRDLIPPPASRTFKAVRDVFARYLRPPHRDSTEPTSYNVVQQIAYLGVIFVLFPLVIWTGLALSPSFDSAVPATVNLLGGRQSARTLHFLVSGALLLFVIVHVTMVTLSGFRSHMRAMIVGSASASLKSTPNRDAVPNFSSQEQI
jgi:thiosulfate reductase cytochrome b subunit